VVDEIFNDHFIAECIAERIEKIKGIFDAVETKTWWLTFHWATLCVCAWSELEDHLTSSCDMVRSRPGTGVSDSPVGTECSEARARRSPRRSRSRHRSRQSLRLSSSLNDLSDIGQCIVLLYCTLEHNVRCYGVTVLQIVCFNLLMIMIMILVVHSFCSANILSYLTLPYLRGGQVITPAQRWGRISSAQCTTPM